MCFVHVGGGVPVHGPVLGPTIEQIMQRQLYQQLVMSHDDKKMPKFVPNSLQQRGTLIFTIRVCTTGTSKNLFFYCSPKLSNPCWESSLCSLKPRKNSFPRENHSRKIIFSTSKSSCWRTNILCELNGIFITCLKLFKGVWEASC